MKAQQAIQIQAFLLISHQIEGFFINRGSPLVKTNHQRIQRDIQIVALRERENRYPSSFDYNDNDQPYWKDLDQDDNEDGGYNEDFLSQRERRRRRRQRQRPSSLFSTNQIPQSVISVGAKASRIAKAKTKKAWKNLMEFTYDESFEEYDYSDSYRDEQFNESPHQRQQQRQQQRRRSRQPRARDSESQRNRESNFQRKTRRQQLENNNYNSDYNLHTKDESDSTASSPPKINNLQDNTTDHPERKSLREVLMELDRLGISYSPKSSRKDLEELLSKHPSQSQATSTDSPGISSAFLYQDEQDQEDDENEKQAASWQGLWQKTSKVATTKVKSIPRKIVDKAEKTAETLSNLLDDDEEESDKKEEEDLILDAIVEERFVDVEPLSPEEWQKCSPSSSSSSSSTRTPISRRTAQMPRTGSKWRRRRRPKPNYDHVQYKNRDMVDAMYQMEEDDGILKLPPSGYSSNSKRTRRSRRPRPTSSYESSNRRVYSPYQQSSNTWGPNDGMDDYNPIEGEYRDEVDNVGHFVANTIDSFLWGREEGYHQQPKRKRRQRGHQRSGHWKDRMEEQFDQFLGIHEGGKYYDRWAYQQDIDDKNATGTDAMSYARGRARRKNSRRSRPVWEEDGSLLSVLFGTGEDAFRRNSRLYRSSSRLRGAGNGGSVLRLSRSLIQSFTVLAGSLGKWASVRGSLPQPVIMVTVLSAGLSARPGRRFQTIVLSVLALRMLGELLHGYMYDDLDFEDGDDDYEQYNNDDEEED